MAVWLVRLNTFKLRAILFKSHAIISLRTLGPMTAIWCHLSGTKSKCGGQLVITMMQHNKNINILQRFVKPAKLKMKKMRGMDTKNNVV